jgi:glyoxylase-like metal-dependent hydrolase (beta-lactamase superfamily II)
VLIPGGDTCVVCDPSIFPEEIGEIRTATRGYERVYVLITHSDFDHVCGIPAFAGDTVIAGATTAAAIADGTARRKLSDSGRDWGTSWEGELRVDLVAADGEPVRCGDVEVVAITSLGHIEDGSAFVVPDRRLLLPGDYLSPVCYPIVLSSLRAAVATNERLLQTLDEHEIARVVPGHGPPLDRDEARRIGREDVEYLRSLQAAAAEAVRSGASAGAALVMVRAVPPPRRARPDFDAFDLLSATARRALAEAGHEAFAAPALAPVAIQHLDPA